MSFNWFQFVQDGNYLKTQLLVEHAHNPEQRLVILKFMLSISRDLCILKKLVPDSHQRLQIWSHLFNGQYPSAILQDRLHFFLLELKELETPEYFQSILMELSKDENRKSWSRHSEELAKKVLHTFHHMEPEHHVMSLNPVSRILP
jgi:hypothetical protein